MKTVHIAAVLAASIIAAPALAGGGHVLACYEKVWVPPTYDYTKTLIKSAHTEWEYRKGQLVKVHYPALYEQKRSMTAAGYYLATAAVCK